MNLSIFSKLTFICNLCLVAAWLIKRFEVMPDNGFKSTIVIAGYLLSFIFNIITSIWVLVLLIRKKPLPENLSTTLVIVNGLFMVVQLYLILL